MHHIADDQEEKCILHRGPGKGEQERDADYHARYGVGHQGNAFHDVLKPLVQAASGSCKGCPVHNQGAGQGGQGRNQDGVFVYGHKGGVPEHIPNMAECEIHLIGPFLYHGYHEYDGKHTEDTGQDGTGRRAAGHVPEPAPADFSIGNPAVPDIIALQVMEQGNAHNGRHQHGHGHHGPAVEIRHAPQHFIVKHRSHHVIPPSHGCRDAVIRKAEEKALYKRSGQGSKKGPDYGPKEGGKRAVPHDPGYNHELFVNKTHGIKYQQEGNRQGVNHIP